MEGKGSHLNKKGYRVEGIGDSFLTPKPYTPENLRRVEWIPLIVNKP